MTRNFKKAEISERGSSQLIKLLERASRLARLDASVSGGDKEAEKLAQDIDCWLEEWTKDDHPHAIRARAPAIGALVVR